MSAQPSFSPEPRRDGIEGDIVAVGPRHGLAVELLANLRDRGYRIIHVSSAAEAKRLLGAAVPSALVASLAPHEDRDGLVRWIRGESRLALLPVIVVADAEAGRDVLDGFAAGADDVLIEGRKEWELADRVQSRIARSRALEQVVFIDALTGLFNRRFLADRFPVEIARAARLEEPLSLGLIDIDHFKQLNDSFGHSAGDRALAEFGRVLRQGLRGYDLVCRFGGEEFAALFPGCDAYAARAAILRLRSGSRWALPDLPVFTFSAGIAEMKRDGATWQELLDSADVRLQHAKEAGRNRVIGGVRRHGSGASPC
jgi:two-component system, cell cycle response regulator